MSEVYRVEAEVTAPVLETEVTERVVDAVTAIFPSADLEVTDTEVRGTTHSLEHLSEVLHRQEILDTARAEFFTRREGDTFSFALKKAAAHEGRVNFSVGSPDELGEISVRVRVEEPDLESVVDHVAPPTEDGRPITG